MSSSKVEAVINGTGKLSDLNTADIASWAKEQAARAAELASSSQQMEPNKDPLGNRDLMEQKRASLKKALPSDASKPRSKITFTDKTAKNAIREAVGPDPFQDIKSFGTNLFIADCNHYALMVHEMDSMMNNTPKFVDAAQGWSPLITRIYCSQLYYIQVFRAMEAHGILDDSVAIDFRSFLVRHPLDTWPVPGPLVNFISGLATSHSTVDSYGYITPYLPSLPEYNDEHGTLMYNFAARVPNMVILFEQLGRYLNFTSNNTNAARTVARWEIPAAGGVAAHNGFLSRVFARHTFDTNNGGAVPTTPFNRGTFANNLSQEAIINILSPFQRTGFILSERAARVLIDNVDELSHVMGTYNVAPGAGPHTWPSTLYWDRTYFWRTCQRMMALYCRHISASVTLADISPSGNTQGHIYHLAANRITLETQTGRFHPVNTSFSAHARCRNNALSSADRIDSIVSTWLFDWIDTTNNPFNNDALAELADVNDDPLYAGPYYYKLPLVSRASNQDPVSGYSLIFSAEYHSQTPLRGTIPDE
nr:MAG: putative coat protein [Leucocoprinus alphapartitivirus 1]